MDHALGVRSLESLQHLLKSFFDKQFCDVGLFSKYGHGVLEVVCEAAKGKKMLLLTDDMTLNEVCFRLAKYQGDFIVFDAKLAKQKWGRTLMRALSECVPVKRFDVKMKGVEKVFELKAKVLVLFPIEVEGDTAVTLNVEDLEAVADKLLCVVYDPR
jgi:hypothetical protein